MSVDYYSRIEQQRGPRPSEQMLGSIARGLRLSLDERDHLFRVAGHGVPLRAVNTDHIDAGLMRILDRLDDTPAQVMNEMAETLFQTRLSIALFGDETRHTGLDRSIVHRWFTDPRQRRIYPEADHPEHSRAFASLLRGTYGRQGRGSRSAEIVDSLLRHSDEFTRLWATHEIGVRPAELKRVRHPEVGVLELHCQVLFDLGRLQTLLVFTAVPGSDSDNALRLLSVIGSQQLDRTELS